MLKLSYDVGPAGAWFEPIGSLQIAVEAEKVGFEAAWFGDHVLPWFHTHAHVPQAWVWITAALERTRRFPVGSDVTVPMFKYHPIVVAQAFATMARIHPGRVLLGVGTGEAINEEPILGKWPNWKERAETLVEAVTLIRKYWNSDDYFDFVGKYFQVKGLFCYDRPPKPVPIYWSAFGPKSALLAGEVADHIMTAAASAEKIPTSLLTEFRRGQEITRNVATKAEHAVYLDCGYGDVKKLLKKFRIHAGSMIPENTNEKDPRKIEASALDLSDEFILERTCLTNSPDILIERIEEFRDVGFDHIIFGDWGYNPSATVKMFGRKIIPYFKRKRRK